MIDIGSTIEHVATAAVGIYGVYAKLQKDKAVKRTKAVETEAKQAKDRREAETQRAVNLDVDRGSLVETIQDTMRGIGADLHKEIDYLKIEVEKARTATARYERQSSRCRGEKEKQTILIRRLEEDLRQTNQRLNDLEVARAALPCTQGACPLNSQERIAL